VKLADAARSADAHGAPGTLRRERGSASVEFALVLPLVVVSLLLVVQVALLVAMQLAVQHAAREGAREAAVTNDDDAARAAAIRAGNLDEERADVTVDPAIRDVGDPVRVTVRYRPVVAVPYVGRFVPAGIVLRATAEQRTERAPP
jgi:Flp pilus assembly protein TadG